MNVRIKERRILMPTGGNKTVDSFSPHVDAYQSGLLIGEGVNKYEDGVAA